MFAGKAKSPSQSGTLRLGFKGLARTNTSLLRTFVNYGRNFITSGPGANVIKLFTMVIYCHSMVLRHPVL
jgi:hypothetical protein